MLCPSCNSTNPDNATNCATCGTGLTTTQDIAEKLNPGVKLSNGSYTVGKVLGRGGFGITYKGSETATSRVVAIKEFFPYGGCVRQGRSVRPSDTSSSAYNAYQDNLDAFLNEAKMLSEFEHPGIVRVYTTFTENSTAYMVMEYLDGKNLEQIVKERGPLPLDEALRYIRAVAYSLTAVHAQNIFHRDIKPDNIIVTRMKNGVERVVLIDFGAARQFIAGKTSDPTRCLTPGYAPLEQYSTSARFDQRTDVYALAATLYYLLTAVPPVDATDLANGVELPPISQLNPDIPVAVSGAVISALQTRIAARPDSAAAFIQKIDEAINPQQPVVQVSPPQPPPVRYSQPSSQSSSLFGWLIAVVGIVIALIAGTYMIQAAQKQHEKEIIDQEKNRLVLVPPVKGQTELEARQTIKKANLQVNDNLDKRNDEETPQGCVVSISPGEGTSVKKDSVVTLTLSAGSSYVRVPDMKGMTLSQAKSKLTDIGLNAGSVDHTETSNVSVDCVVSCQPNFDAKVKKGSSIRLTLASPVPDRIKPPSDHIIKIPDPIIPKPELKSVSVNYPRTSRPHVNVPFELTVEAINTGSSPDQGSITLSFENNPDVTILDNTSAHTEEKQIKNPGDSDYANPLAKLPVDSKGNTPLAYKQAEAFWVKPQWPHNGNRLLHVRVTPHKTGSMKFWVRCTLSNKQTNSVTKKIEFVNYDIADGTKTDQQGFKAKEYQVDVE